MDTITTRFIDEWFVSYHLTWHIPLNKAHRVPLFSWSVPTVVRHGSSKTENRKGFFVNRYRTALSRFLNFLQSFQTSVSFKVSRLRRSVGQSE